MKRKLTNRLTALLLSAFTVISALPFLGWGMRVRAVESNTTATATEGEFMRIFHLDCGRKYFSVSEIEGIIDQLSANHYTHLQLAFGNDGFRFLLDDMAVGSHSSDDVKTKIKNANSSYSSTNRSADSSILSQTEMDEIVAYAKKNGIEIIPLLNSPGHMTVLLNAMKELDSSIKSEMNVNQGSGTYFDPQTCTAAAELTKELVGKYAKYFAGKGSKYFNLGADECGFDDMSSDQYAGFVNYINDLNAIVKGNGMTSIAFNDGFYRTEKNVSAKIDTDVLVCYWTSDGKRASTEALSGAGYKIINANNAWYYVLGDWLYDPQKWGSNGQWGYSDSLKGINNTPVTKVVDGGNVTPVGSMLCMWCDGPHKKYEDSKENVYNLIKAMAEKNPDYFKEADAPEQTLTDSATGITVTLTPSGGAAEYVYSIEIKISVKYIDLRNAKVTVGVTITENGQPYTNGATLKIPYETWNSYLAESGFGIDKVIELAANVSGDEVVVEKDETNKRLVLTVPHFSDVEIDATIADDSTGALNTKEIILDIGDTTTDIISGANLAGGSYTFDPTGIATVTVTGKDEVAGKTTLGNKIGYASMDYGETYTGVISDGNGHYLVIDSKGNISSVPNINSATVFEVTAGYNTVAVKGNGYYLTISGSYGSNYALEAVSSDATLNYNSNGFKNSSGYGNRYIVYSENSGNWTISNRTTNAAFLYALDVTDPTPASSELTFKGVKAGTTKVTIGNTEYTIKVRKAPVDVTVNCVCDGEVVHSFLAKAKDNFDGGYDYSITAPSVSGYKYKSGKLSGTVTGDTVIELTYVVSDGNIYLPVKFIDYRADGMLFDFQIGGASYPYGLIHGAGTTDNNSTATGNGGTLVGSRYGTKISGTTLENTGYVSGDYYSGQWYAWGGAWSRSGLVKPNLKNGLPEYTDATIAYVAGLMYAKTYNSADMANVENFNDVIYNTFIATNATKGFKSTSTTSMSAAFTAAQTWDNIQCPYDLAYYLLNNLFTEDQATVTIDGKTMPINGMYVDKYKSLVLVSDGNGVYSLNAKNALRYGDSTIYEEDGSSDNLYQRYDSESKTYVDERHFYPLDGLGYDSSDYFGDTTDMTTGRNGNFAMVSEAQFVYNPNQYFTFNGDDDVYLYINGVLALDLGGAHGVCTKTVKLSDVAEKCGLTPGEVADFKFFYMERNSSASNFSVETNIELAEPAIQVEKNAYAENGNKLVPSGSAVPSYSDVIYDFVVRNTGNTDMTNLVLTDTDEFSNRAVFGQNSKATGSGKAKFDFNGPFTVWVEGNEAEAKTFTTYDEATAYVATVTLAPGESLHVKGLRGKFTPGTNSVFTYNNTLEVSAKAGDKTLKGTANHKLYSFDIGDTSMAYVVDFGLPMTISRLFDASIDATKYVKSVALATTGKYGTIRLINAAAAGDTGLEYILTSPISGAEIIELDITLDIEGTSITTHKYVTIIPATTVYYEDNFDGFITFDGVGCEWTTDGTEIKDRYQNADRIGDVASNVYGYDDAYKDMSKFSLGSAHKVTVSGDKYATASFSFYGTGFDVISATTNTSGTIVVTVTDADGKSKNYLVDTYYGYTYDSATGKWTPAPNTEKALWQIPVMKVAGLDYGKYDVTITVAYADFFAHGQNGGGSYDFWLDAIRIYDPAGAVAGAVTDKNEQTKYDNAYRTDGEGWPTYTELRDMIIAAEKFTVDGAEASGIVFIDGSKDNQAVSMADYTSYGPNNELYLAKSQAVAFVLKASGDVADIQIALKAIQESKAAYAVIKTTDGDVLFDGDIATATDMYRSILAAKGKTVVITNTGDGILSITNLKVTYNTKPTGNEMLSITMDGEAALAAVSAVDEVLNPKTPFEPGKVDVKVDGDEVTVITSPDVDEIEIDGEKVTDSTIDPKTGNKIWKKPINRILKDNPEISVVARDKNGNTSAPVTAPVVSGGSIGSLFGGFIGRLIKNILSALFG